MIRFTVTKRNVFLKKAQGLLESCQWWAEVQTLQIWMHLYCLYFTLTAVPSVPFHSAKRLMCFPKAAVCRDIFETFYTKLKCLTANQIPISSLDHMLQHMFHWLLDNANTLCFVLLLSSYPPALYSQYMRNCQWQVCCITCSRIIPLTRLIT